MPTEIVKVQRPIATNDPDDPWLIYDKARKHQIQVPARLIPRWARIKMGDDHKAFFRAEWSNMAGWGLLERAPWQEW